MLSQLLKFNFLLALSGTLGSLFFSEVMQLPPCNLCWYQRICLYPLVVIFGVAIWKDDRSSAQYAFPITLIGLVISVYHNLLYYGVISEALAPCTKGVSCSSRQLELFGFVTIPLMSMLTFLLLGALIYFDSRLRKRTVL